MSDSTQQTALVTGASSGIGAAFADLLAADGCDVVLVARSEDRLRALGERLHADYGVDVTVVVKDLSTPDSPAEIEAALDERGVTVDVLVNNAGFGIHGPFVDADADRERDEIQVNVAAVTDLTRRFLPGMVARGRGRVCNVASTAAFQPGPFMAVYYATKAYVLSFSEAIAEELDDTGVTVTALCPGPTETRFGERAGVGDTPLFENTMDARAVAEAGYHGMQSGRVVVVPGLRNKLLTQLVRITPRRLVRKIVRRMQEP